MQPLLVIDGLHQFWGDRHVLKGIDLTVHRGEIVGLIGKNGSGKSTLTKVIAGWIQPRSGTMTLEGERYRPQSRAESNAAGISVIEQDFAAPLDLTILRAMFRNTFMADWEDERLRERGAELLARTEFDLDLSTPMSELDPAGRSLAEVLRVLAEEAQIVIFDEVTALLNDLEIAQMHHAARLLRDQGCAVIHIAHRLEEVTALCDRVVVVRRGKVVHISHRGQAAADELVLAMLDRPIRTAEAIPRERGRALLALHGFTVPKGTTEPFDLAFHAGEIMGVIGLRNSGALEVVEAVAGRVPHEAAGVEFDGRVVQGLDEVRDEIAYVAGPSPETLGSKMSDLLTQGQDYETEIERLRDAIRSVQDLDLATTSIETVIEHLSGGDRQKVAVAAGAQTSAHVVIFNHPSRGADVSARERTYELVERLAASGRAVILLSVDVSELMRCCDRIAILHEGRLVAVVETAQADEDVIMGYALTGSRPEATATRLALPREVAPQG